MLELILLVVVLVGIAHVALHLSFAQIKDDIAKLIAKFEAEFSKKP